jgi:hypothetical protein
MIGPVIHDLLPQASTYLSPILLSEEEGIEKPNPEIFDRALHQVNLSRGESLMHSQCLHVGDELEWCIFSIDCISVLVLTCPVAITRAQSVLVFIVPFYEDLALMEKALTRRMERIFPVWLRLRVSVRLYPGYMSIMHDKQTMSSK